MALEKKNECKVNHDNYKRICIQYMNILNELDEKMQEVFAMKDAKKEAYNRLSDEIKKHYESNS